MEWTHLVIGALGILALVGGTLAIISPRTFASLNKFAFSIGKVSDQEKQRMTNLRDWEIYVIGVVLLYMGIGAMVWLLSDIDPFRLPFLFGLLWFLGCAALIGWGVTVKWFPESKGPVIPLYGKPSQEKTDAYWRFAKTYAINYILSGAFGLILGAWMLKILYF